MKKKMFCLLLCLVLMFSCLPAVSAETAPITPDCKSAVLIEAHTGQVIWAFNENERLPEASITKVMTMLLVFEALDSGRISMEDMVSCSEHAASMGGSQIWLEPGEQMTVHELIKAALVGSANDASVALAEHVAGTHESFVAMMNERAAELGMKDTAYKNCTGLDADGHITSALDIAIVSAQLLKHDKVREYTTIWMDSLRGGELELTNTNRLVRYYDGCVGVKTGTTSLAGCCVSAAAERDGMTLIAVIMGAPNSKTRFSAAEQLLDYGFASVELADIGAMNVSASDVPVTGGMEPMCPARADVSGKVLVAKGRAKDVAVNVSLAPSVSAPVEKGQTVGCVTITLDGQELCSYNVLSERSIEKISFGRVFALMCRELVKT